MVLSLGLSSGCVYSADDPVEGNPAVDAEVRCPAIVVADRRTDGLHRFDGCDGTWLGNIESGVVDPSGVAHLGPDTLFVASFRDGSLWELRADASVAPVMLYRDTRDLEEPVAIIAAEDRLLALGRDSRSVLALERDGAEVLLRFKDPALRGAHALAIGPEGLLYVATAWNGDSAGRIQVLDAEAGELVDSLGPELVNPVGLEFVDRQLYIADWGRNEILTIDPDTREPPRLVTPMEGPLDVASASGVLFVVSEQGLYRIEPGQTPRRLVPVGDVLAAPRSISIVPTR